MKVNNGSQEVARSHITLLPKKLEGLMGMQRLEGVTPMTCQKATGRSHLKSRCLRSEGLVHRPLGQTSQLISFMFSWQWRGGAIGGSGYGMLRSSLPRGVVAEPSPLCCVPPLIPFALSLPPSLPGPPSWTAFLLAFPSSFLPQALH